MAVHQDVDRCPLCWLPVGAGEWTTRSRHRTSLGEVEYCAGPCGCLVVLVDGQLVKRAAGPAVRPRP
ncbi:hypothetical protein [Streptomyces sp. NPDC048172]|uniref:hypothetical protein n=1 Tax=Streptomyces sp. NPDC048172 TaxID=3365505 RepID=UPI003713EBC2